MKKKFLFVLILLLSVFVFAKDNLQIINVELIDFDQYKDGTSSYFAANYYQDKKGEHLCHSYNYDILTDGSTVFDEEISSGEYGYNNGITPSKDKILKHIINLDLSDVEYSGDKIISITIGNMKFVLKE